MATISPEDVKLTALVTRAPHATKANESYVGFDTPSVKFPMGALQMEPRGIVANATALLRGSKGEDVSGWRFGFIQLMIAGNDWAVYRGRHRTDGSVVIEYDRPPVRSENQLCRDSSVNLPHQNWYGDTQTANPTAAGVMTKVLPDGTKIPDDGKLEITVEFSDVPQTYLALYEANTAFTPSKPNPLYKVQRELEFTTIFAAQFNPKNRREGAILQLAHFSWSIQVNIEFTWDDKNPDNPKVQDSLLTIAEPGFKKGPPTAATFKNRALDKTLPICTILIAECWKNPAAKKYYTDWVVADFDYGIKDPARVPTSR